MRLNTTEEGLTLENRVDESERMFHSITYLKELGSPENVGKQKRIHILLCTLIIRNPFS